MIIFSFSKIGAYQNLIASTNVSNARTANENAISNLFNVQQFV